MNHNYECVSYLEISMLTVAAPLFIHSVVITIVVVCIHACACARAYYCYYCYLIFKSKVAL